MIFRFIIAVLVVIMLLMPRGEVSAWDPQWQFKQETRENPSGTGTRSIEMQRKFEYDPMKRFKGTMDVSSGHTVVRNLNGETMRGTIDRDGFGLLRDQDGDFHRVNTR